MLDRPLRSWDSVMARAREVGPCRVVVAAAEDPEVLKAAEECQRLGLAEWVLIGDESKIAVVARTVGCLLEGIQVIHQPDSVAAGQLAARLASEGQADIIMKGKVNTADLMRAVLDRNLDLRTGRWISGTIVFEVPGFDRLMVLSDASISIAPTLPQKAQMIENAIATARVIGIHEPKVAVLTAFEFVNPEMPATVDAANLTLMGRRGQIRGAVIEGPMALDLALSKEAAAQKGFESPVAGEADVFLCPDIEAANVMIRAIIYFARGKVGGVLQGTRVPIVLLSRAEPAETKINSIALAVLVAREATADS